MSHSGSYPSAKNPGNNKGQYYYVPYYPAAPGAHMTTGANVQEGSGSDMGGLGNQAPEMRGGVVPNNGWFAQYDVRTWRDVANPAQSQLQSTSSLDGAPGQLEQEQPRASPVVIPGDAEVFDLSLANGASIPFSSVPDHHSELPFPYNIERPPPPEIYDTLRPPTATEYAFNKYDADNDETHKVLPGPPARPSDRIIRKALEQKIDKKELNRREVRNEAIIRDMEQDAVWMGNVYPPRSRPRW